ncbi:MAG: triphosphoribosyl-dephospho-CoA synthase [Acinetobacter sp.]
MNAILQPQTLNLAQQLADLAVQALLDEVRLSPKPALVDRRGSGAHQDLTLSMMEKSAHSLRPMFVAMSQAAIACGEISQTLRERIGQIGRDGEHTMLSVTDGVNTHRGAIWALGVLVTATSVLPLGSTAEEICIAAGEIAQIEDVAWLRSQQHFNMQKSKPVLSHGQIVWQKHQKGGAKQQAQMGFPAIRQDGLPQLHRTRQHSKREDFAQLDALLAIMQYLDDSCVLYRAGPKGLTRMQQGAAKVLALGGVANLQARRELHLLEIDLLRMNASAGGAADLLAATLFVDAVAHRFCSRI